MDTGATMSLDPALSASRPGLAVLRAVAAFVMARIVGVLRLLPGLHGLHLVPRKCAEIGGAGAANATARPEEDRLSAATATFTELGDDGELVDGPRSAFELASGAALDGAAAGCAGFAPLLDFTVTGASAVAVAAAQWDDPAFYASFLADADPHVGDWVCDRRVVETRHPLGFEPPRWTGVSGSIPTRKAQRRRGEATRVAVVEESRFADIPFADAIVVWTLWVAEACPGGARARVLFRVVFGDAVPSWLRGVIAAKTRGELALVYGAWEAETRRGVAGGAPAGPEPASPADEAYVFRPPSPVAAREDTLGLTDDQRAFVLRRSRP